MSDGKGSISGLKLVGGALCLDFANTTGWRPDPGDEEFLRDYEDLLVWALHAGGLDASEKRALTRAMKADPEQAQSAFRSAISLREAVYRIFSAAAAGRCADAADLDLLNRVVEDAHRHLRLVPRGADFGWGWHGVEGALELPLWRVARSAADLLVSPEISRVRECSGHHCDWLFLDASKNHTRRWCDMANCGNREKARRHYERRRTAAARSGVRGAR